MIRAAEAKTILADKLADGEKLVKSARLSFITGASSPVGVAAGD